MGGIGPLKIFESSFFLSSSPFHPIFHLFLLPPPLFLALTFSEREQCTMRYTLGLTTKFPVSEPVMGGGECHPCPRWDWELGQDTWGALAPRLLWVSPNVCSALLLCITLIKHQSLPSRWENQSPWNEHRITIQVYTISSGRSIGSSFQFPCSWETLVSQDC